jgi:alpha-N-arabinofuranosidase
MRSNPFYSRPLIKSACLCALPFLLACFPAVAQTIFNQNFDGGFTGGSVSSYTSGGSPANTSTTVLASGGNPNGCMQVTMTATTTSDSYTGQAQLQTVSGNTDANPADYVLSFDAKGNHAGNIVFILEMWQGQHYALPKIIDGASANEQLSAANTWQNFQINLANITSVGPTGGTWQLNFRINASQWGGTGQTNTLLIDNILLTHLANNLALSSSLNPAPYGVGVAFTARVLTNGIVAGNANGQVVFSSPAGPFSTNTVNSGIAASSTVTNLPGGTYTITALYSGGNYPSATNTINQTVTPPPQTNLSLYTDNLVNGFQNWSWATVNLKATSPAPHSSPYCISVTDAGNQALWFHNQQFNTTPYASLSFWINGGAGGQQIAVIGDLDDADQVSYPLSPLGTSWQQVTIPLSALGVANQPNCTGFLLKGTTGSAQPTFYVDDVQLVPAANPPLVHLGVNASQTLHPVDARQFGVNTATWDGSLGNASTLPLLQSIGIRALRWPGGSTSDGYDWTTDASGNARFRNLATNLGAQVFTTVNYGGGTPALAASWVASANGTYHCNFKYWEIGNECYGSWENDTHAVQHDPYTYATNAVAYIQQMKAAFPSVPISVGVVVVPGEDSYANNTNHFALNPRTLVKHNGWTPVMLSTMNTLGVLPDFIIYHFYPQYTPSWAPYSSSPDSDPLLLQVAGNPSPLNWSDWASAAASLRQQLTDYMGPTSSNVELCVTENNSDAGPMGRQSTSIIDALYLADSTAQLMKTEFRSYVWWDLHNGQDTTGNMDPTIYGWRSYGDYGLMDSGNNPYPTFYAQKLLQSFARPGDTVLNGSSDNLLLSTYAARRSNGALTLLVISKNPVANQNAQIALSNFAPWTTATVRSYGLGQDQATETNGAPVLQDIATNSATVASTFNYNFPPLSLTLFTFSPAPSRLAVLQVQPTSVELQLQGQPGASYAIQSAPNVVGGSWISIATNLLTGATTNITLPVPAGAPRQFYRSVWLP